MTESIESAEPADDSEPVLDMAAMRKVRKEAAELRKRNLELEEQLGAATARETAHRRDVVAAAAQSAGMIDPSDFLAVHPDPAEFLDEQFRTVIGDRVRRPPRRCSNRNLTSAARSARLPRIGPSRN